jgi:hypothetical protein
MSGSMYWEANLGRYVFGLVLMVFVLMVFSLMCVTWCVGMECVVRPGSMTYSTEVALDAG